MPRSKRARPCDLSWLSGLTHSASWQDLDDDYHHKPMLCRSVGWLFRDGTDCKVIVPHVAEVPDNQNQGCGDMTIPTISIRQIQDLLVSPDSERSQEK